LSILCGALPARAEIQLSYEDLLSYLTDLNRLPVIEPGVSCKQFSSYDRASKYDAATDKYINWDANGDAGQYLRVEPDTQEGVMAEMDGPGCIFRIWSANPQGRIRFYLDGDSKPTYEWDFNELFTGKTEPFVKPLVWKRDPRNPECASDCYLPIPYARSCKVTSVVIDKNGKPHKPGHYYHIDYRSFPKDWKVESFKLPLSDAQKKALDETVAKWSSCGTMGNEELSVSVHTIAPGQSKVVARQDGAGVITALRAKLKPAEKWGMRKVLLRAYWDGQEKPAIDCPIGDFFGEPRDVNYKSYPMGIADRLNYCFFPMPFHKSARIELVNEGKMPASVETSVTVRPREVPENWGLFHARYRQEQASTTFDYPFVEATGTGKFVGVCLFPDNLHGGWWGEGDEKVYVDGEKFPSWFGTGSEDYFGDAWGILHFVNPSHGHPHPTNKGVPRMQGCYRWHIADNIPFYKSFKMTIENYAGLPNEKVKNDYYSVAYWYQLPGGSDFFAETPVSERVPRGHVARDAIEAEKCVPAGSLHAGMTVVDDESLAQELSGGHGVKLVGKVGDTFDFVVRSDADDRYVVEAATPAKVKASAYEILVNGSKMGQHVELPKGPNKVTLRFTGEPIEGDRCEVVIDYFRLTPYRSFITNWMIIGPFANPDAKGLGIAYPPESELKMAAKYKGRDGVEVGWQPISRADGMIVLNDAVDPKENCVMYGACVVNAPKDVKRMLLLGSDDGCKVWLNGEVVWEKKVDRALQADQDRVEVELKKGPNNLLIKLQQQGGDLGWAVRFANPDDDLTYSLPK
jgi:hypothetical protein